MSSQINHFCMFFLWVSYDKAMPPCSLSWVIVCVVFVFFSVWKTRAEKLVLWWVGAAVVK